MVGPFNLPVSYYTPNMKQEMKTIRRPDQVKKLPDFLLKIFEKTSMEIIKTQKSWKIIKAEPTQTQP